MSLCVVANATWCGAPSHLVWLRGAWDVAGVASRPSERVTLVGLIRVNACCTFSWEEFEDGRRRIEVGAVHCPACVEEMQRRGYELDRSRGECAGTPR